MKTLNNESNLRDSLNKLEWPALFPFKFIVPVSKLDEVLVNFQTNETTVKLSREGNYASVSTTPYLLNPDKVFEIYNKMGSIKGLISL